MRAASRTKPPFADVAAPIRSPDCRTNVRGLSVSGNILYPERPPLLSATVLSWAVRWQLAPRQAIEDNNIYAK